MRQAQQKRLMDTLQAEQNLLSQQTSTNDSPGSPTSPNSLMMEKQISNDGNPKFTGGHYAYILMPGPHGEYEKRLSYISHSSIPNDHRILKGKYQGEDNSITPSEIRFHNSIPKEERNQPAIYGRQVSEYREEDQQPGKSSNPPNYKEILITHYYGMFSLQLNLFF